VPEFICLHSRYNHVTEAGGPQGLLRHSVKTVTKNDGDFLDVILLYHD